MVGCHCCDGKIPALTPVMGLAHPRPQMKIRAKSCKHNRVYGRDVFRPAVALVNELRMGWTGG
jgi:hypothetical protein